ncbi:MAG: cytochrome c3 family protein [Anaerolineales bacterium]|nr:cytochrome c3 family protein [Anaerolineales bacterium]
MKFFKPRKEKPGEAMPVEKTKKSPNWFKISVIANIVLIAGAGLGLAGMAVIHQSDTNPNFCALCHIMEPNVSSYLTSNHLDSLHMQAGVECKDCHDYTVVEEVKSGINYMIGNYEINQNGDLLKQKYSDDMCFQCHISYSYIADQTSFLENNPHSNHNGQLHCNTCHISHGDQIDYCSGCHENGGQRMVEVYNPGKVEMQ